jgi:hypothetical protein
VLVTSRSFEEYQAFFALTPADLARTVLDSSAGASGFAAGANARGCRVVAVDPGYAQGREALLAEAARSTARGAGIVDDHEDRFVWSWYGSRGRRDSLRRDSLDVFAADLRERPGGYVAGALPRLPFSDAAVDLALCSHLLFTWSDVLGERWHEDALVELLRVAAEVRVSRWSCRAPATTSRSCPRCWPGCDGSGTGPTSSRCPTSSSAGPTGCWCCTGG